MAEKNTLSNKERMKIERSPMPEQDPKVRSHNFQEVNQGLSAADAQIEATRCIACGKPDCVTAMPGGSEGSRGGGPDLRGRLSGGGGQDARRQRRCRPSPDASVRRRTSARADA